MCVGAKGLDDCCWPRSYPQNISLLKLCVWGPTQTRKCASRSLCDWDTKRNESLHYVPISVVAGRW
jgi:hypothetical protein